MSPLVILGLTNKSHKSGQPTQKYLLFTIDSGGIRKQLRSLGT